MTRQDTLDWLADLQAELSSVLRAPLDPNTGALRADVERYPSAICAEVLADSPQMAADRLAIYNRQYWLRLLRALQRELPLTCRLLGAWRFNQIATRFVLEHPPRDRDLGQVAEGFEAFLENAPRDDLEPHAGAATTPHNVAATAPHAEVATTPHAEVATTTHVMATTAPHVMAATGPHTVAATAPYAEAAIALRALPRLALIQAAHIDCAYRRVFRAPAEPRFEAARGLSPDARLRTSQAHARVTEHWPLLQLRARILGEPCERPVALPEPLLHAQTWALVRTARGIGQVALEPQHARLLALVEMHPLSDALAQLEQECADAERDALPQRVKRWLSRSVKLGMFAAEPT